MSNSAGVALTRPTLPGKLGLGSSHGTWDRIVVIGAGIAGSPTAVALQRRHCDVSIIEARTETATGAAVSI
nr:FAD-dependent oxidoreductase [Mycobacterium lacus]